MSGCKLVTELRHISVPSCAPQCHIVFQGRYFLDAKNILTILTKLKHYINLIKRLNVLISVEGITILKQKIEIGPKNDCRLIHE